MNSALILFVLGFSSSFFQTVQYFLYLLFSHCIGWTTLHCNTLHCIGFSMHSVQDLLFD